MIALLALLRDAVSRRSAVVSFVLAAVAALGLGDDAVGLARGKRSGRHDRKNTQRRDRRRSRPNGATAEGKKKKKKKRKKPDAGGPDANGPTGGAGGLPAPIPAGISFTVHHGYNDPLPGQTCSIGTTIDHCDNQQFGLDFNPPTQDIVSPAAGRVKWIEGECLGIQLDDGGANLTICHFARFKVADEQRVSKGQCLGTKESHIHISLDDRYNRPGASPHPPIPFTGRYALEGQNLEPTGQQDQWKNKSFTSTNSGFCATTGTASLKIEAAVRDLTVKISDGSPLPFQPRNPTIWAEVELRNADNRATTLQVQVTYDGARGAYIGTAELPAEVTPGPYVLFVKFRDRVRTLKGQAPSILSIQAAATNVAPRITLVPGDVNDDGQLTNTDYTMIAACNTQPGQPAPCSGDQLKAADIDDSGVVDLFDLNLYLRALSR